MDLSTKILSNVKWDDLTPTEKKHFGGDQQEFEKQVILVSFRYQLRYNDNLIQKVITNEKKYYEQLIAYSLNQLMVFPYHLQDKINRGLKVTSFSYYHIIVKNVLVAEKSYDSIPNFTAADCVRLLGIGRNQFIDLMNTFKGLQAQSGRESAIKNIDIYFPSEPLEVKIEPWYHVHTGFVHESEYENSSDVERSIIDLIIDHQDNNQIYVCNDPNYAMVAQDLHRRGLVYFDVPIEDEDRFDVPTLDNFIMNRVSGDQLETMMYKVFVSLDRNSSVKELADDLQIKIELVRQALSIFCRVGFANKYHKNSVLSLENTLNDDSILNEKRKIAFLFDSTLTAYLMMGNLSFSLKKHAVTMFEVGRLTNESLKSFVEELDNLTQSCEGEAKVYYNHAVNLKNVIAFLTEQAMKHGYGGLDLIRSESLLNLDDESRVRILSKNYSLLISMAPITFEDRQVFSKDWPLNLGPTIPELNSPWFKFYITYISRSSFALPIMLLPRGYKLRQIPDCFLHYSRGLITSWGHDPAIMSITNMVYSINDMLKIGPVLVQAHDCFEGDSKVAYTYIPLPILKLSDQTYQSSNLNSPLMEILVSLNKHLPLDLCCGYLTFIPQREPPEETIIAEEIDNLENSTNANDYQLESSFVMPTYSILNIKKNIDLTSNGVDFMFSTANLGIPLFDQVLVESVMEQMTQSNNNLFESQTQKETYEKMANLLMDFKAFLKLCGAFYSDNSHIRQQILNTDPLYKTSNWPLPSKPLLVNNGKLIEWN